jgi:syntaxin-binding protein 5
MSFSVELLQLLIGYESGLVVLWDLKTRTADCRFQGNEPLRSVAWLSDGKQLVTAHADGSVVTWSSRPSPKPVPISTIYPHGKISRSKSPYVAALHVQRSSMIDSTYR